jgi:hypothetical protein
MLSADSVSFSASIHVLLLLAAVVLAGLDTFAVKSPRRFKWLPAAVGCLAASFLF